jgi:hypothetical protein
MAVMAFAVLVLGCDNPNDTKAPENVTNLAATPGDSQVALTWTASANSAADLAGYKVYQDNTLVASLDAATTQRTATGLVNGTSYDFKVTAVDGVPNENSGVTISSYANSPLSAESFNTPSGLADGGAVASATQYLTGTLPNPSGSTTAYEGKAYLVINGSPIPVEVTQATSRKAGKTIYKEGKAYPVTDASLDSEDLAWLAARQKDDSVQWIFSVTFSINAGPNQLKIEVYDLNDSLYASTGTWEIVGAIEPSSMVVTLWWDTNLTDIDLHASPDDGATHCYYSNMWAGEMVLDYDDVDGYGPEHITVDNATTTATYKIKVYYYADHNEETEKGAKSTTPTTCYVTAQVNGETKLDEVSVLSSESTASSWMDGAHVWNVGEVEVTAANRLDVTLGEPDLSAYPEVSLPVTILNPADENNGVEDLGPDNIFVINAGTAMAPVEVEGGTGGVYDLTFTDITAGKRNVYVYVYAPSQDSAGKAEEAQDFMGGLSNTITYGTNYAVLVGLNEYPPAATTTVTWSDIDAANARVDVKPKVPSGAAAPTAGEFEIILTDNAGGTNRPQVSVAPASIANQGGGVYRLTFATFAHYLDYDSIVVKYQKEAWLTNSLNDDNDIRTTLLNLGTSTSSNMWEAGNITTLTNAAATRAAMLGAIETTADKMNDYDLFLFFYSGHGANGTTDANQYLCTYEDNAWTSVTDLSDKLDLILGPDFTNIFVVLDACFSGNFIDMKAQENDLLLSDATLKHREFLPQAIEPAASGKTFKGLQGDNLFVITAVDGAHSAWDVNALQNGAFTYYFVEGLDVNGKCVSAAAANTNNDPWLTGEEGYNYAAPKARKYVVDNILPTNPGASEDPQVYPNTTGKSRLIYNW